MTTHAKIWILSLLLGAGLAWADEPVTDQPVTADKAPALPSLDFGTPASPLMEEIQALLQTREAARRRLEEQAAKSADPQQVLQIQRRLQAEAVRTELQVMRIQAEHLRRAGLLERATALETQLEIMTAPRPVREPTDRPAPTNTTGRR